MWRPYAIIPYTILFLAAIGNLDMLTVKGCILNVPRRLLTGFHLGGRSPTLDFFSPPHFVCFRKEAQTYFLWTICSSRYGRRSEMREHSRRHCHKRMISCENCGYYNTFTIVTEKHYPICPRSPIDCPKPAREWDSCRLRKLYGTISPDPPRYPVAQIEPMSCQAVNCGQFCLQRSPDRQPRQLR